MTWTYHQSSGCIASDSGAIAGVGYSGKGISKNLPSAQSVEGLGPIPEGCYTIEEPIDSPVHGPLAMHLLPDPENEMFGRSLFMVHGDSKTDPGNASEGCIILPRSVREAIWQSGDRALKVIA